MSVPSSTGAIPLQGGTGTSTAAPTITVGADVQATTLDPVVLSASASGHTSLAWVLIEVTALGVASDQTGLLDDATIAGPTFTPQGFGYCYKAYCTATGAGGTARDATLVTTLAIPPGLSSTIYALSELFPVDRTPSVVADVTDDTVTLVNGAAASNYHAIFHTASMGASDWSPLTHWLKLELVWTGETTPEQPGTCSFGVGLCNTGDPQAQDAAVGTGFQLRASTPNRQLSTFEQGRVSTNRDELGATDRKHVIGIFGAVGTTETIGEVQGYTEPASNGSFSITLSRYVRVPTAWAPCIMVGANTGVPTTAGVFSGVYIVVTLIPKAAT